MIHKGRAAAILSTSRENVAVLVKAGKLDRQADGEITFGSVFRRLDGGRYKRRPK